MVRRMYRVDLYLRVRRAVMVEGMSMRETSHHVPMEPSIWARIMSFIANAPFDAPAYT